MANDLRTYRHRGTGLLGEYGPRLAALFKNDLEEVDSDAPPVYEPVPQEVVDNLLGASADTVGSTDLNQEDAL
jgi:hypothetical protein